MLLNIQGGVIDTTHIYRITNIYGKWDASFEIQFLNSKSTVVYLQNIFEASFKGDVSKYIHASVKLTKEERQGYLDETYNKLEIARKTLLNYWNSDSSPIPEIKI